MIKVAITDDHPMVLSGLQQMLQSDANILISGVFLSGRELLAGIAAASPDVLLLDINLSDAQGDELIPEIIKRQPTIKILALTSIDATFKVKQTLAAGAAGYSLKNVSQEILRNAITQVYNGEEYIDPVLKENMLQELLHRKSKTNTEGLIIPSITPREKEILKYLAEGKTSIEIAKKLFLSTRTVENHRKNLLHKFKTKNTLSMVRMAMEMNLID